MVIDPWWVTYCAGSVKDFAYSCALDNAGNTLLTGSTESANFPVSAGAFQSALANSSYDAFVIKFDPYGNRLWATYYGGGLIDAAIGITADISNNVLIRA